MASKSSLRYLLSLTPGTLVVAGNLSGGWWSLTNAAYTMVLLIGIERLMKENKEDSTIENGRVPDVILSSHVLLHTLSIVSLIYGIHAGILVGKFIWWASLSTGIGSGIEGINSAHEMIHRKQRYFRLAGIWNLLLVNYSHFYVEHIRGHHRYVGTRQDPATAHYGESFYHFFRRTVPSQYLSALNIEAVRLRKENRRGHTLRNLVIQLSAVQAVIGGGIFFLFGGTALLAYLVQSFVAFFLLEYVNYIEHYGLSRSEGSKVNATHSWQSDMPISRFALIELSRHSDHHITASRPYYQLVSHEESPVLPTGYFGSFYLALFPSLWFKKVNPLLEMYWRKSDGLSGNKQQQSPPAGASVNMPL